MSELKIAIDVSPVIYGIGTSVYTKNLVRSLLEIDKKNQYLLFGGSLRRADEIKAFFNSLGGNYLVRVFPIPPTLANIIWNKLGVLPVERLVGEVDVFHSSDWTQPPSKAFCVTTVHDLWPVLQPDKTNPKIASVHRARLERVKKYVDAVIVPSEATKADLINYGVNEQKITVIYEAVSPKFLDAKSEKMVKTNKFTKKPYFLSVGVGYRKNTMRLIKAFEKYNQTGKYKLVIVGNPTDGSYAGSSDVVFTGHIPDLELKSLYSNAEALIYPSLHEGFGLPILEAFSHDCPVITSNCSSMVEIAGDAAILVDPLSIDSIVDGIEQLEKRKSVILRNAKSRLKDFSWEKTASQTLKVYEKGK